MTRSPRPSDRKGAVMFVALATLAIVAAIAAAMLQGAVIARRHLRAERDILQVDYLLDMALTGATVRAGSGDAESTVAEVASDAIVGSGSARITSMVEPAASGGWRVAVVVEYPLEGPVTVRRRRDVVLPPAEAPPPSTPSEEEPSP